MPPYRFQCLVSPRKFGFWVELHPAPKEQGTGGTGLRGVLEKVAYSNRCHAIRNVSRLKIVTIRCVELWAHAEIANPWFDRNIHKNNLRTAIEFASEKNPRHPQANF